MEVQLAQGQKIYSQDEDDREVNNLITLTPSQTRGGGMGGRGGVAMNETALQVMALRGALSGLYLLSLGTIKSRMPRESAGSPLMESPENF